MLKDYSSKKLIQELLNRGFSISHFQKNFAIESLKHDGQPPFLVSTDLYEEYETTAAYADVSDALDVLSKKLGMWSPSTNLTEDKQ